MYTNKSHRTDYSQKLNCDDSESTAFRSKHRKFTDNIDDDRWNLSKCACEDMIWMCLHIIRFFWIFFSCFSSTWSVYFSSILIAAILDYLVYVKWKFHKHRQSVHLPASKSNKVSKLEHFLCPIEIPILCELLLVIFWNKTKYSSMLRFCQFVI